MSSRAVADALRRLPVLPERAHEVDGLAMQITVASWLAGDRVRSGGAQRAADDLWRFGKICHDLGVHLLGMRAESRAALREQAIDPDQLFTELQRAVEAGRRAYDALPADGPPAPRGRPEDHRAEAVTASAAAAYERLTGRAARYTSDPDSGKRDGPVVRLVAELFDILGIRNSAGEQVRAWRKKRSETGINHT